MTDSTRIDKADGSTLYSDPDGLPHRLDGPAIIVPGKGELWYAHGQLHRVGGPAVVYDDGRREYWQNNERHRTDGPAVTKPDGSTEWWVNGRHVTDVSEAIAAFTEANKDG